MRFIDTYKLLLACVFVYYAEKVTGSSDNFDQQNLKLLTSEDGTLINSNENDQSKYTETSHSAGIQYTFNPDVKCVGVKYDGHIFWVHRTPEHGNDYPTSVFLDNQDHDITIFFGNIWYYTYKLYLDKYTLDSSKKPLTENQRPQEVQLFASIGDDGKPQDEMPNNKYQVVSCYKAGEPRQIYYYFEDNCEMVQCEGQSVWKHTFNSEYPISMIYLNNEMIFQFNDGYEVYKRFDNVWEISRSNRPQQNDQQEQGEQQGESDKSNESDSSLRGSSSDGKKNKSESEKQKSQSAKFPDALADALILVIMLTIIATVMVVLVMLMSLGLSFYINKRAKSQSLISGRVDYV